MKEKLIACLALLAVLRPGLAAAGDPYALKGWTTKATPFYAPGERMVFEISLEARQPLPEGTEVEIERTGDDGVRTLRRVKAVSGVTIREETSLAKPGFVRVLATLVDAAGKPLRRPDRDAGWCRGTYFAELGAGVEPEKLQSVPEPPDFDRFMAAERELLARTPLKAEVRTVAETNGLAVCSVRIDCAGPRPVTGYLSVPLGARKGVRYPALLLTHGWGTTVQNPPDAARTAKDVLTLEINAHGYELGRDAAYYKSFFAALETPEEKRYAFDKRQNSSRETAYFRWMRLRVMRALQYLKTRPEWNGTDLRARGGSQGGLQSVWAASCGEGVTKAEAEVPWCCDIGGSELGRNRGDTDRGAKGAREPWYVKWTPALGYYDPVNHARRVPKTCDFAITRAGLGDYVCPPAGVSVLYNNLPCRKRIVYVQGSTHGLVPPPPNQTAAFGYDGVAAAHPWKGRCVAFLGDSITDPRHVGTRRNYWQDLGDLLQLDYASFGQNGQNWNGVRKQAERAKDRYGDRLDALFVFMGTNDYMGGVPLGEWFSESEVETVGFNGRPARRRHRELNLDPATFRGRINVQLKYLKESFPDQQIVLMTPIHRAFATFGERNVQQAESYANSIGRYVDEYVDAIREAGSLWSVPVIDLFAESGLHPLTVSHAKYFSNPERDLLHPNAQGHDRLARTICARLMSIAPHFK